MFWGLIMEPGRCYTQTVKVSFHVSMAALDISNSTDEPAQVMCVFEGRNYLLCTLNKKDKLQCPLDLNFETGSKVSFATNGKSHVHLTGYLTSLEDDFDEEEEEEEEPVSKKEKKRTKKEQQEGPPKKKSKVTQNSITSSTEEAEEEESDSDFDVNELMNESGEEEGDEGEEGEDEGEEEEDDEGEEEASSLSEAESEEETEKPKPKLNGIAKNSTPKPQKKKEIEAPKKKQEEKPKKQEEKPKKDQKQPKKQVLKGGVMIQDLKEGSGEGVKSGKFVHVYYEGRLKDNNKMFDSTTKGPGFSFRVGKGEVIKGWDIGLVGMKVGGKRRIVCPPNSGYGAKGSPPVIPPNATLVFDVELKKIS